MHTIVIPWVPMAPLTTYPPSIDGSNRAIADCR
jgi:hypothetical protein